jgi:hypothetical protein
VGGFLRIQPERQDAHFNAWYDRRHFFSLHDVDGFSESVDKPASFFLFL